MTPAEFVSKLEKLGLRVNRGHSSKNYVWLELHDERGRQIALANIPTSKPQVSVGIFNRTLKRLGIRDVEHLNELLSKKEPAAALREILPPDAARWRPGGQ